MRPQGDPIAMPEFPEGTEWINAEFVRTGVLLGQNAVLVWFWDYTSLNSLRALPYVMEWRRRYNDKGLKVLGVHSPQFEFGADRANLEGAVERLGIEFPVANDSEFKSWRLYGAEVWPSLYIWDRTGGLRFAHFAEGEYEDAERCIQELIHEIDADRELPELLAPLRDTDATGARVQPPTPHRYMTDERYPKAVEAGDELVVDYSGASAWAVLDGRGKVDLLIDGEPVRTIDLEGPQLYELNDTGEHEQHQLRLRFRNEALAYAFSFAPGLA